MIMEGMEKSRRRRSLLTKLESTFRGGVHEEKRTTLRRCVKEIVIDRTGAILSIRRLPSPGIADIDVESTALPLDGCVVKTKAHGCG